MNSKIIITIFSCLAIGFILFVVVVLGVKRYREVKDRIEVVGENGKKYTSYNDALYDLDFVSAHNFVDKMNESVKKGPLEWKYRPEEVQEAYENVFKKEVSYLMYEMHEIDNVKIIYLIKEVPRVDFCFSSNDDLCDYVLDMSIMLKNEELCKMVLEIYESDENKGEATLKYKQALKEGKFD